jgi:hypothetical protein
MTGVAYGISCPTIHLCVAVDDGGSAIVSTDPTGGPGAWTSTQITPLGSLLTVSCPSATFCLTAASGTVLTSENPGGGAAAWTSNKVDGSAYILSSTCPTTTFCLVGDLGAFVVVGRPGRALTISRSGTGAGTVTSDPLGIDCGTTCSSAFIQDSKVTLTATPASGSVFTGWSGAGCSGTGTCQVTMSADQSVEAVFDMAPPPDTKIMSAKVNGKKATFGFTGSGGSGALHFECRLGAKPFSPCTSPKSYGGLKPGKYTFQVRAIDAASRIDATPAKKTITIKAP